jgi:hypothetical protein
MFQYDENLMSRPCRAAEFAPLAPDREAALNRLGAFQIADKIVVLMHGKAYLDDQMSARHDA